MKLARHHFYGLRVFNDIEFANLEIWINNLFKYISQHYDYFFDYESERLWTNKE